MALHGVDADTAHTKPATHSQRADIKLAVLCRHFTSLLDQLGPVRSPDSTSA